MSGTHFIIQKSGPISGEVLLAGAKNAALVIVISTLLVEGKSRLKNVPASQDILHTIELMIELGARVTFNTDEGILDIDTTDIRSYKVRPEIMKKTRASILVLGPLLARFGRAHVALPGGDAIGMRPINYHINNFVKMGVAIEIDGDFLYATTKQLQAGKIVLEYPSVGATENILMAAVLAPGKTRILNAALEPEVFDLIDILKKMGAQITIHPPATLEIEGVSALNPIEHTIIPDRLEAGTLLLAAAVTGGVLSIPNARADHLDLFLAKLEEMGHQIIVGAQERGITIKSTRLPKAVSFKTTPYPGFPTDLQAPMMVAQSVAQGVSVIEETVFENRFTHVKELQKMGASILVEHNKAIVTGVLTLLGAHVIANDIRAASALMIAGLIAQGVTLMDGVHHARRGHNGFEKKLTQLGGIITEQVIPPHTVYDVRASTELLKDGA
jgi:UDP-N-acetylglucosamine 1-carboxyvinyltransferase